VFTAISKILPTWKRPRKGGSGSGLEPAFSFGTTSLNRLAFQKALDDIGAREAAGTDFFVQVLASEFEHGVKLLANNELHPALPEGAFKTVTAASQRRRRRAFWKARSNLAGRALKAALLPANDPTLRQATPATISSLTHQDVKDYYRRVFRPDLTSIVVIGKVTPEEAKAVIEKHFGSWTASGPKPRLSCPGPAQQAFEHRSPGPESGPGQGDASRDSGAEPGQPDYYALELGNHVLGGAFYATRLYQGLREKSGLVYYVGSSFDVGQTRAIYMVNFACDPQNVSRARISSSRI